ncbi:ABC transporter substrate-binding protein [Rubritalea sp.]|uniref:ABC transporter substrate-binding protein n=1 Tax=Rubritalea sp. TaxID=2109375 RepID=UPI003EF85DCB
MRSIHNEYLEHKFELPEKPQRIVSLVSSATEAIDCMGFHERLCGVSEYCHRYIDTTELPVVGQYMTADLDAIKELKPDLVLLTTGIQRRLSKRLAEQGLPIYNFSLPSSFEGILENIHVLGGLMNELAAARKLTQKLRKQAEFLRSLHHFEKPPRVYVELWLGRHRRAVGGLSYIRDIVEMAGGTLVYAEHPEGYFENDCSLLGHDDADAYVFFHEPEFLVDGKKLVNERGWNEDLPVLMSTVEVGDNMIQDGPSMLETVKWLHSELIQSFR